MKLSDKGITIRKTIEEDLHQIYTTALNTPFFNNLSFPLNPENLADIFASENSILFCAVRKKKVLGFIIGSVNKTASIIHWISVRENFRKAGIEDELLRLFSEQSIKLNADTISIILPDSIKGTNVFFADNWFSVINNFSSLQKKLL